jgi:outer membrane autotransporter protein
MALAAPSIQLNNIRQRLDQLRLIRSPAVLERLRVSVDGKALPPLSAFSLASDKDGKPQKGGGASADAPDAFEHWGVFVNGDVNLGKQSAFDTQTGFELRTKGLTLGTDYRFIGNHILGAAVGLMRADTELEGAVGTQDADGRSLSFFGSFVPRENAYVDGILTFGRNDYDSERRASTGTLNSVTQGNQWGMAVSAGYAINRGPLAMTPFGRIEHIDARVDAFSETGSGDDALSISEQRIKQTTLALGANASYAISTSWGVLAPTARMEFVRIASSSSDEVIARLAGDTIGLPAQLRLPSDDKSFGSFAIGVTGVFSKGVSGYLNYERQFSRQTYHDERFGVGIRAAF